MSVAFATESLTLIGLPAPSYPLYKTASEQKELLRRGTFSGFYLTGIRLIAQ